MALSARAAALLVRQPEFPFPSLMSRLCCGCARAALLVLPVGTSLGVLLPHAAQAQIALNPGNTTNDTYTVAPNTRIPQGIYGDGGTTWTVVNYGTVAGAGGSDGVNFTAEGAVDNSGTIITGGPSTKGILLGQGGTVTNRTTGALISGGVNGIEVDTAAGTITNAGSVVGGTGQGIQISAGGTVSNGGLVTGGANGIFSAGAAGTVGNTGTIVGTNGIYFAPTSLGTITNGGTIIGLGTGVANGGLVMLAGGAVSNGGLVTANANGIFSAGAAAAVGNTGTIVGDINGVYFDHNSAGTVTNGGTIIGIGTGVANGGIVMLAGGAVSNGGMIQGLDNGIYVLNGAGTVTNSGIIFGTVRYGIILRNGGTVTNGPSAVIVGVFDGMRVFGATGTVTNQGTIETGSSGTTGIDLQIGGSVSNLGTASLISSGSVGVNIGAGVGAGTILNQGTISSGNLGIELGIGGGSVTNAGSASRIAGGYGGVFALGPSTVINDGTITGSGSGFGVKFLATAPNTLINGGTIIGGTAVQFGGGDDLLVVQSGGGFGGGVDGGGGVNALELASGPAANIGTITGIGTSFINFSTVTVDADASWAFTGANTIGSGVQLTNSGTLANSGTLVATGHLYDSGTLTNSGSISGTVTLTGAGTLSNSGTIIGPTYGVVSQSVNTGVTNTGSINGIYLQGSGTVLNLGSAARISSITDAGIRLDGTGTVTNQGAILGQTDGVYFGAGGTLVNDGTITGVNIAAFLNTSSGNNVVNRGSLSGGTGLEAAGASDVTNSGTITGTLLYGVLQGGGTLANSGTAATITGPDGVLLQSFGTVTNGGRVTGTQTSGIELNGGGLVSNAGSVSGVSQGVSLQGGIGTIVNTGTIVGGQGVLFSDHSGIFGNTLVNSGAIVGNAGTAVQFGAGDDMLIVTPGASFGGSVDGAGGSNVLELAAGVGSGTLGAGVTNFGTVNVDTGATWLLAAGGTIAAGVFIDAGTLTNAGTIVGKVTTTSTAVLNNQAGALIGDAGVDVAVSGGATLVGNAGTISGQLYGIAIGGGAATITNAGTIGSIDTNAHAAVAFLDSAGTFGNTLINSGTIVGNGGTAVQFGAGDDLLVISPSAVFGGTVDGAGGSNRLELAAGTGTGTLAGIGTSFTNFGTIAVDPGANWLLPGNETVAMLTDAGTLTNAGSIAGSVTVTGTGVLNNQSGGAITNLNGAGIVLASGGTVANAGLISGRDGIDITGGSVLITNHGTILSTGTAGVGVLFTGGSGTIDNFGSIIGNGGTAVRFAGNANTLIIESGGVLSGIADGSAGANILLLKGTGRLDAAQIVGFQFAEFTGAASTVDSRTSIDNTVVGDGASATALTNQGTLTGTLMVSGNASVTNVGTIAITTGSTNAGSVTNNALFTNASSFANAGSFTNAALLSTSGTVINSGLFTNTNTGTILGTVDGLIGSAGTIANSGLILGTSTGVVLTGGSLVNAVGGTIRGGQYGIQVAGGTVTNAGTILDDVAAGASLGTAGVLNNGSGGLVSGAIGAIFTGSGASLVNSGTIAGTSGVAVQFATGAGTGNSLTLDTGAVLTGRIDGGGGSGQITLAGTGTLATPIQNFGTGSALSVASGADWTASGSWTIANVTNSGTFQPGTPGSPLHLTGDFTQSPAATFRVMLNEASGLGSELIVTGKATLAGAVQVVSAGSFLAAKRYTIVQAAGGVTGTFDVGVTAPALLAPTLGYDADDAFVTLVQRSVASPPPPPVSPPTSPPGSPPVSPPVSPPTSPPAIFETPNQHAAAVAVDQGLAANPAGFADTLRGLDQLSAPQLRAALDRLSGEIHTALTSTALQAGDQFVQQFEEQGQLARRAAADGPSGQAAMAAAGRQQLARLDGGTDDPVANIDRPWGVWTSGYGESSQLDGDGNAHRLTDTVAGGAVGADYKLTPALRVGAGLGYGGTSFSVDDGGGRAQVDHTQVALYAGYNAGPAYLDGTVGFAYGDGTTQRNVSLPGALGKATGHFTDDQLLGAVEAGYGLALGHATVTPFAGLSFGTVDQDGFAETGAGVLDLRVAKQSDTSVRSVLGSRLSLDVPVGAALVTTDLKLGWAHEFASVDRTALLAYAGAPTAGFAVTGAKASRDSAVVGFGIATAVFADTSLYLHYDGDIDGPSTSHAISAGFRVSW